MPGGANKEDFSDMIAKEMAKKKQKMERLLKDQAKTVYINHPHKEKTVRHPREMMKNVQGSSAGAGSGEFHVYKAARRREYERLKLMEEETEKVCCRSSSPALLLIYCTGRNGYKESSKRRKGKESKRQKPKPRKIGRNG